LFGRYILLCVSLYQTKQLNIKIMTPQESQQYINELTELRNNLYKQGNKEAALRVQENIDRQYL
jgi:CHASE3 domain sensor protein